MNNRYRLTVAIFFFLFWIRLANQSLFIWIFGSQFPDWFKYLYTCTLYTLVIAVVWVNQNHLSNIHVDNSFIAIILIMGGALFLWYLPFYIGILIVILAGSIIWALRNKKLVYQDLHISPIRMGFYILIVLIPTVPTFVYMSLLHIRPLIDGNLLFNTFLTSNPLWVIVEELLFRGLLWMLLLNLGISERKVIYIQMLCFWLVHYNFLISRSYFSFWVSLPFVGLVYGLIVQKSKSITPTIVCHFLYNFAIALINLSF